MPSQTREEAQEAELAQARLDDAQQARSAAGATLEALRRELEAHKRERDAAEQHLVQCRQQRSAPSSTATPPAADPRTGSLRHFLRYHRPAGNSSLARIARNCWSAATSPPNWPTTPATTCSAWR